MNEENKMTPEQIEIAKFLTEKGLIGEGCWHEWSNTSHVDICTNKDQSIWTTECVKCHVPERPDPNCMWKHTNPNPFTPSGCFGDDGLWERWKKDYEQFWPWWMSRYRDFHETDENKFLKDFNYHDLPSLIAQTLGFKGEDN